MSNQITRVPAWIEKMRTAAQNAITEDDIQEIVKAQVEKAKKGDAAAMRFVFEQVLGGASLKGATFIQNNFPDDPNKPSKARPGTPDKVMAMQQRVAAGRSAFDSKDTELDLD